MNLGGGVFARTLATVVPHIAQRKVRWAILEWNPSLPVSNSLAVYDQEMALIEQYRPALLVPWGWGDPFYQVKNSPFETALRDLISRLKNGPPRGAPVATVTTAPATTREVPTPADRARAALKARQWRDAILDRDRAATVGRVQGRRER